MMLDGLETVNAIRRTPLPPNEFCKERWTLTFAIEYARPKTTERPPMDMTDAHTMDTFVDGATLVGFNSTGKAIRAPLAIGTRRLLAMLRRGTHYFAEVACSCGSVAKLRLENWRSSESMGCSVCVTRGKRRMLAQVANPRRVNAIEKDVERRRAERTAEQISSEVDARRNVGRR